MIESSRIRQDRATLDSAALRGHRIIAGLLFAVLSAPWSQASAQSAAFSVDRIDPFKFEDSDGSGQIVSRDGIRANVIASPNASAVEMEDFAASLLQQQIESKTIDIKRILFVVGFYKKSPIGPNDRLIKIHEVLYFKDTNDWARLERSSP
ncbi:MAG TPA: hypothetical protein VIU82_04135 [Bosea sp. (in: a-proteobacteria)]